MVRRCALAPIAVLAVVLVPRPAGAWGFDLHKLITARAIEQLPAEIRPFFEEHRTFVVEHSIDPDLWRNAGFEEEPPRHFVDLDAYGAPPFEALPRDYDRAVQEYGREFVHENGTLPWRGSEIFGQLVRAFEQHRDGKARWALENATFYAAILSHYTADAHVPLHAVLNYDGQKTNQKGVHTRFESELYARFAPRLTFRAEQVSPVQDPRSFLFDTLIASFGHADAVLEADRRALGTGTAYDAAYFERFLEATQPLLEARVARASGAVAAMIAGAWEQAGRPSLSRPASSADARPSAAH